MKLNRILILLVIFISGCSDLNYNITKAPNISPSKKELVANGKDHLTLTVNLQQKPHKDQTVFVSTSQGKLYAPPIIDLESEGVDSVTLKPNSKSFTVMLRSELDFSQDSAIVTALVNGYLHGEAKIAFEPSCPEELIASLDKDSMAINSNQDKIIAEIAAFCSVGSVSDGIRIKYELQDPTFAEVEPKILYTSNGIVNCEIFPKEVGNTNIKFFVEEGECAQIDTITLDFKVYEN